MAVFAVPGPSVPGLAIPGDATPGDPGGRAVAAYTFTGLAALCYLQYLGPGGTLAAAPGSAFNAGTIAEASGYPYVLAVPPADGRWVTEGGQIIYAVLFGESPEGGRWAKARNSRAQARRLARRTTCGTGGGFPDGCRTFREPGNDHGLLRRYHRPHGGHRGDVDGRVLVFFPCGGQ